MAKPKGPHGRPGDGSEGGEDGGDNGVPRQRGDAPHGRPTTVAETHQAVAAAIDRGRPGGPASENGKPAGSKSEDPKNNPELDKHDPGTLKEIAKARDAVADKLQKMADDAWDHVDQNRDEILQREGYQRQREKLVESGKHEDVADLIVERTALGIESHRHLADAINAAGKDIIDPATGFRLRPEVGYDSDGVETTKIADQAFRPDVILERQHRDSDTGKLDWEAVHAYDLKTGLKTGIAPGWADTVKQVLDLHAKPEELRPTQRPLSVD
ncbi:hypothetical protein [Micromonospora sp. NPDC048947]|uniref:hypothetical protein n=1 Tax=Micromonospora sp. NPDC048947 TaxID=3154826 RepID=UPI0033D1DADF